MLSLSQPGGQVFQSIAVIPGSSLVSGINTFVINPANWEAVKTTRFLFPINFIIESNQIDNLTGCIFSMLNDLNDRFSTLTPPNNFTIAYCLSNPSLNHKHLKALTGDLTFTFSIGTPIPSQDIRIWIHYSIV